MMMNNENKKLSRNRKGEMERKFEMDNKMESLMNGNNSETNNKNIEKLEKLEIELVKINYANIPNKSQNDLKELNRIHVFDKHIHEIRHEMLLDYAGEFEMVGRLKIGDQIRTTHIRFRNNNDYEAYIKSIDEGYGADDAIFNGYF